MSRLLQQPAPQAVVCLLLLGWMACLSLPAHGQTEEKTGNVVNTAEVLARLHSKTAHGIAPGETRRNEDSPSPSQKEPVGDDTSAVGESGEASVQRSSPSASSGAPKFQLTPYIWFSGFKGTVGARGRTARVDVKFSEIFEELNFAAMGTFEVTAKADVGGLGGHNVGAQLTWQLFGGLGLNLTRHLAVIFGYRHLDVDYRKGDFLVDFAMSGLVGGFGLRF